MLTQEQEILNAQSFLDSTEHEMVQTLENIALLRAMMEHNSLQFTVENLRACYDVLKSKNMLRLIKTNEPKTQMTRQELLANLGIRPISGRVTVQDRELQNEKSKKVISDIKHDSAKRERQIQRAIRQKEIDGYTVITSGRKNWAQITDGKKRLQAQLDREIPFEK